MQDAVAMLPYATLCLYLSLCCYQVSPTMLVLRYATHNIPASHSPRPPTSSITSLEIEPTSPPPTCLTFSLKSCAVCTTRSTVGRAPNPKEALKAEENRNPCKLVTRLSNHCIVGRVVPDLAFDLDIRNRKRQAMSDKKLKTYKSYNSPNPWHRHQP